MSDWEREKAIELLDKVLDDWKETPTYFRSLPDHIETITQALREAEAKGMGEAAKWLGDEATEITMRIKVWESSIPLGGPYQMPEGLRDEVIRRDVLSLFRDNLRFRAQAIREGK